MEKEIWKDVLEYPNEFMISNHGRVWSKRTNKILSQRTNKQGYKVLSSRIGGRNGKPICRKVHRWVAEVFVDNPENKPFVNHDDCDKSNNYYKNLEWCTSKENVEHAIKNNLRTSLKGFDNPSSIFNEDDIVYIRTLYKPRHKMFGTRAFAREFNVPHNTISKIVNNKSYRV